MDRLLQQGISEVHMNYLVTLTSAWNGTGRFCCLLQSGIDFDWLWLYSASSFVCKG